MLPGREHGADLEQHQLSLGFDRISLLLSPDLSSTPTATILLSSTPRVPLPLSALLLPSLSLNLSFTSSSTPSHLLAQLKTTPLHFSLRPILRTALANLATQLSKTFPLIFNPTWTDVRPLSLPFLWNRAREGGLANPPQRLTNDRTSHEALSASLSSILSSSSPEILAQAAVRPTPRAVLTHPFQAL